MSKKTNWFKVIAIVFAFLLAYASYDIGRRTTFPGSRPQLKERIKKDFFDVDSTEQPNADDLRDSLLERANDSVQRAGKFP